MMKMKAKTRAKREKRFHYTGCGLDNVYLVGGVTPRKTPRGTVMQIEDLEGLHRAIGHWLVHEKKDLTGKEFRFLRHEINLTQQALALLLRTDVQNIGRWERDEGDKIPGPAQGIIRLLYDEKVNQNKEICESLRRLAELDEKTGKDEDILLEPSESEGWSAAAA